jgi:hypothetical protein
MANQSKEIVIVNNALGYVYKLFNEKSMNTYVGSTVSFSKRKTNHKSSCSNVGCKEYNYKVYQMIRNDGGFSAYKFEVLDIVDKRTNNLAVFEQAWIDKLKPTLNSIKASQSKLDRIEYLKQYKKIHKAQINIQQKKLYWLKKTVVSVE